MTAGRTSPILCGCTDEKGNNAGEFVVKLLGRPADGANGALLEFMGSRLASHFGILVPEAAAVEVDVHFAKALERHLPHLAQPLQASIGLNFGSRVISPMTTWLIGRTIPEAMRPAAETIFAFDALIQNPDRRVDNPNLFTQGDHIYVYDHETSFSFLVAIAQPKVPWDLERENYLDRHVFFARLKSKPVDLKSFSKGLSSLNEKLIASVRSELPSGWMHADLARIETHMAQVNSHADEFIEQVRRRLI